MDVIRSDSPVLAWLEKHVVEPLSFHRPLPRIIGITIGYRRAKDGEWGAQLSPPRWRGDWLWRNGLVSLYLHLPFGISLSLRLPFKHNGIWWGWTLQAMIGWKSYNGVPSLIFRIQNDSHTEYNNPSGPSGRAKGLEEGYV